MLGLDYSQFDELNWKVFSSLRFKSSIFFGKTCTEHELNCAMMEENNCNLQNLWDLVTCFLMKRKSQQKFVNLPWSVVCTHFYLSCCAAFLRQSRTSFCPTSLCSNDKWRNTTTTTYYWWYAQKIIHSIVIKLWENV